MSLLCHVERIRRFFLVEIIFVCTGNTCRSPMAEALMKNKMNSIDVHKKNKYKVSSAGIFATGEGPSIFSTKVMWKKYGIDISNHVSRRLTAEMIEEATLVLCMEMNQAEMIKNFICPNERDKVFTLRNYVGLDGEIIDPYGSDESIYEECARLIDEAVTKLMIKEEIE